MNISLKEMFDLVGEFHRKFEEQEYPFEEIPTSQILLRKNLAEEELEETNQALLTGDKIEAFDGYLDQLFILIGSMRKAGFTANQIDRGFVAVYESNMSKLQDGKVLRRDDGKILKGDGYFPPKIKKCLTSS